MKTPLSIFALALALLAPSSVSLQPALAQDEPPERGRRGDPLSAFTNQSVRSIGPALTSGRIIAFAVNPADTNHYFAAAASGGVWKTTNNGTTWTPVFDSEGSYSIGAIAMDPKNPSVVWVGTGECNGQRSVGYGDGVYRSDDGGRSWRNVGLKLSEHIGRIVIDPRDSNTVYVAAQGPLWGPGGERGLYKTTDGGKTWTQSLKISDDTGVTDVVLDPRNPDVLYAASWQRRRHVFTYVGGGPESGIHRSTDGGATWTRLRGGLPFGDMGRIGLAVTPADPRVVYATVEASGTGSGTYATTDGGATWEKRGDFVAQGMYYGQIIADPKDADRIYIMSVSSMISEDGGRTTRGLGERNKHVDNHALWIDPANTKHLLEGCDGGIYETFDRGETWVFKPNLPLAQFYRVAVDNSTPFYYVYGGTQDNNSLGGPSRTRSSAGITNDDWFVTLGGDGFHQQVDPKDPNIVYSVMQDGGLSRFDRRTGARVGIQPIEGKGEAAHRWYWDSPLLISPHSNSRLYFAGNILFRSDDRGNSWRAISPDLTRQIDRNQLKVFGKVQRMDAIARGQSTSYYGNIISLTESPVKEGLIYVGTDDGLIQVTEDGGRNWRKLEKIEGVPENTYVGRLLASQHEASTVYALFDNHKNADFAPYVMKSTDAGRTWTSIAGNLPKNGPALAIAEDHVSANLLFIGTEFGLYLTTKGGAEWRRMRSGLPTIPVRDLAIQKRENDLVIATFGRGFYILDDYSPLRYASQETMARDAALLPVKDALIYTQNSRLGGGRGSQGENYYVAPNPPYGATFVYTLKEGVKSLRQKRQEAEQEAARKGEPIPFPSAEQLRAEADEDTTAVILSITDSDGNVIRRVSAPSTAGLHRVNWDLRGAPLNAPSGVVESEAGGGGAGGGGRGGGGRGGRGGGGAGGGGGGGFGGGGFGGAGGFPVLPGEYRVSLSRRVNGETTQLVMPVAFTVRALDEVSLSQSDRRALEEYRRKVGRLQQAVTGTTEVIGSLSSRLGIIRGAVENSPKAPPRLREEVVGLQRQVREIERAMRGDGTASQRVEPAPPTIVSRVFDLSGGPPLALPTGTRQESYRIAAEEFTSILAKVRSLVQREMPRLEKALDEAGIPHTPGRLPEFSGP